MNRVSHQFSKFLQLALGSAVFVSIPLSAAPVDQQLRFSVSPGAADPVWKTKGIIFEKQGQCFTGPAAIGDPKAKIAPLSTAKSVGPIFNPGFPKPDGSYVPNSADDGFNVLFMKHDMPGDPSLSMACEGRILANGVDVTAPNRQGRVSASFAQISANGPLTVKPQLDTKLLQSVISQLPKTGFFQLRYDHYTQSVAETSDYFDIDGDISSKTHTPQSDIYFTRYTFPWSSNDSINVAHANGVSWDSATIPTEYSNAAPKPPSLDICKTKDFKPMGAFLHKALKGKFRCLKTSSGKIAAVRFTGYSSKTIQHPEKKYNGKSYFANFEYYLWN
ncbi:hypothetical protein [Sphingorhabdus sp.]|uniref:hypothetical protein n=3 Tax=Sphingorhabdus sp. TaxID=1902408 RepID=UPI003BB224AF|nr:hypothetical protein [Sphingomonadales bacterium]MBK9431900.1 hypothetical protein [Sphingomonadales bacterium]